MFTVIINFLCLGFNVLVAPVMTIIISRNNIDLAAQFTTIFSWSTLLLSAGLFNQKNYIAIWGDKIYSFSSMLSFRLINISIIAFFITLIGYCLNFDIILLSFIILMKYSELLVDFSHSKLIFCLPSKVAALKALKRILPRSTLLIISYIIFYDSEMFMLGMLFIIFAVSFWDVLVAQQMFLTVKGYLQQFTTLKNLGFISLLTSVYMLAPRLFVNLEEAKVELVALSISPLVGLFLQAIWLTNIASLRIYSRDKYLKFILQSILVCVAICITWPIWDWFIINIYLINGSADVLKFKLIIFASIFFFLGANIANLLKIINQKIEVYAYITATILYFILTYLRIEMYISMIISAFVLFLFSLFGLYVYERNDFHQK